MEKTNLVPACGMKNIVPDTTDQFWNALRHKGGGPPYVKIGRKVYYRLDDVEAWIEGNRFTRTDRPVGAESGEAA